MSGSFLMGIYKIWLARNEAKYNKLSEAMSRLPDNDPEYRQLRKKRDNIEHVSDHLKWKIEEELLGPKGDAQQASIPYQRPTSASDDRINNKLGPLPPNAFVLAPTTTDMEHVRLNKPILFMATFGILSMLTVGAIIAPWLLYSPASLPFLWISGGLIEAVNYFNASFGILHVVLAIVLAAAVIMPTRLDNWLYRKTAKAEQRYRMGAENWTWSQRIHSCVAVPLTSLFFVLLYPVFISIIVIGVSACLLYAYLDAFGRSWNTTQATLESIKLHMWIVKTSTISFSILLLLNVIVRAIVA